MTQKRFAFYLDPLPGEQKLPGVFSDPRKMRRKRFRRRALLIIATLSLWIAVFFFGVEPANSERESASAQSGVPVSSSFGPVPASNIPVVQATRRAPEKECRQDYLPFSAMADGKPFTRIFAHLPGSLDWSHLSLQKSCAAIGVLITDWIAVTENVDGINVSIASEDTRKPVETILEQAPHAADIMPRIQFDFFPAHEGALVRVFDARYRATVIGELERALSSIAAAGACLDLTELPKERRAQAHAFIDDLRRSLEANGLRSCIILNGNDREWQQPAFTDGFDHVVVKLFYEPWLGSAPTPLSGNTWFLETAEKAIDQIGSDRLVLAIGTFGVSWTMGDPLPKRMSFGEAMLDVEDANAHLIFNADVSASFATFRNSTGVRQKIWLQDAATAFNQVSMLRSAGSVNLGIWSLGQEDPGVWRVLNDFDTPANLSDPEISDVFIENYVHYTGSGPALRILDSAQPGRRSFEVDPQTKLISNQSYRAMPLPYQVERYGKPAPGELILTFDDGPHPEFTPRVLEILEETKTPAAFFVLGQNVMNHPDILKNVIEAGHDVGAHSFSHPRMDQVSRKRLDFEHALADRAIASAIGRTTRLYREPFLRSGGPIQAERVGPLSAVQERGQINFGMDIVPKDWLDWSSAEIASYVIEQVEAGAGNVILLHDGGGTDRTATIEALPVIITELRDRGYDFVSVANALSSNRSSLMPSVSGFQPKFDRISFSLVSLFWIGLECAFWIVLMIGVGRSLMILVLAAMRRRHHVLRASPPPKVAVIIPAFNEEAAIGKCIKSVLASDYPELEVVVVDDGSSDATLNEIFEFKHKTNVRVISHPNQGKWSALNRAILSLEAEIAVCIDADTQVAPDAISKLAGHFRDQRIGAVAGKIAVGNQVNLLTRMQALEYVTAQNFERRAFDNINGILVVPGAIGAWRVAALHKAGLFRQDTLTEDCDLTISVNRVGYRVIYDETAVAYTEAPQSVRMLMAQRLRWSLGMFQSAWKHKAAFWELGAIGRVSIPDMMIFGYLFPLLAPIADLFVLIFGYQLIAGHWSGDVGQSPALVYTSMIFAYLSLPALEVIIAAFAVFTDPTAKARLLLIWPFQRLLYRPLLYLTVFRALLRAVSGDLPAWGRPKRHGSDPLQLERVA